MALGLVPRMPVACPRLFTLFVQNRTLRRPSTPGMASRLWPHSGAVFESHQPTDLVLPDDSASVIEDITHDPITLGDYLTRAFVRQIQSSSMSADRKEDVNRVLNHNLVTFGAVRAVQPLLMKSRPITHYLAFSRYFSADEIKRDNVVLIGGKKAVPWDYLFDNQLNFVTDYDYASESADRAQPQSQAGRTSDLHGAPRVR